MNRVNSGTTDWKTAGDVHVVKTTLSNVQSSLYVRVRGTSTGDPEPSMDSAGENPWTDLWFYSNPIFVEVK